MQIVSKVNGDTLSATEFNQIPTELQTGLITSSGQTPTSGTLDQVGIAVASYGAQGGVFAVDSGAADAYVLTQVSPFKAPFSLKTGLTITFRAGNANTGACTANAFGLTAKNIKQSDGSTNPTAGMISTTQDTTLRYDGTVWRLAGISAVSQATTDQPGLVELLTNAELAAGTDTTKAATAAAIASLFGTSLRAANGYIRIPIKVAGIFVEIILQWGTTSSISASSSTVVNFPLTYTTACYNVQATLFNGSSGDRIPRVSTFTTSTFTMNNDDTVASHIYNWFAIGY